MKTYPYQTPEGIIELIEKRELDQLVERLAEARESHLAASARDVQTIQRQSVLLERLADALASITEEYEDRKSQFGDDYLWGKHENVDALPNALAALAAYESSNLEPCKTCGGSKMTPGWYPTYQDPDNVGMHPEAEPCPDCQPVTNPIDEENARLIAAAPDLLEALEKCASVIGAPQEGNWATDDEVNDAYDSAVAAIAKAKGEQP